MTEHTDEKLREAADTAMSAFAGESFERWLELAAAAARWAIACANNDEEIEKIEDLLNDLEMETDDRQDAIDEAEQ